MKTDLRESKQTSKIIISLATIATAGFLLACAANQQRDWKETAAPGLYGLELWNYGDANGEVGHPFFLRGPRAWCLPSRKFSGNASIDSGRLPPGLDFDQNDLSIRGIPTERGHWIVKLRYSNVLCGGKSYEGGTTEVRFHITGSGRVVQ